MKKMTLDVAELKVDSFETYVAERDLGTVRARQDCYTWSCGGTCGAQPDTTIMKEGVNAVSYKPVQCCV